MTDGQAGGIWTVTGLFAFGIGLIVRHFSDWTLAIGIGLVSWVFASFFVAWMVEKEKTK